MPHINQITIKSTSAKKGSIVYIIIAQSKFTIVLVPASRRNKTSKLINRIKHQGPTEIRTRVTGIRTRCDNYLHYGTCCKFADRGIKNYRLVTLIIELRKCTHKTLNHSSILPPSLLKHGINDTGGKSGR